jgi:hypothetical protein
VKKSLTFSKGSYKASYPYNKLLAQLPENKEATLRMMKALEAKLKRENLCEQFNENILDFQRRGVVSYTETISEIENMQKSYIPLTFTLKKDPMVTTKLRICGNSSFKVGKCFSLNDV